MSDVNKSLLIHEPFTAVFPSLIRALDGDATSAIVIQALHFKAQVDADASGWVAITYVELGERTGLSKSQVYRSMVKLRDRQLLMEDDQNGYNNSKLWRIDYDQLTYLRSLTIPQGSRMRDTSLTNSEHKRHEIVISTYIEEDIRTNKNFSEQCLNACNLLADLIAENGSKRPTVTQGWITDMDKLNRIDKHTWEEIQHIISWSQNDSFWRTNILSPGKLRKQFDQLRLKAQPAKSGTLLWAELAAKLDIMEGKELEQ